MPALHAQLDLSHAQLSGRLPPSLQLLTLLEVLEHRKVLDQILNPGCSQCGTILTGHTSGGKVLVEHVCSESNTSRR